MEFKSLDKGFSLIVLLIVVVIIISSLIVGGALVVKKMYPNLLQREVASSNIELNSDTTLQKNDISVQEQTQLKKDVGKPLLIYTMLEKSPNGGSSTYEFNPETKKTISIDIGYGQGTTNYYYILSKDGSYLLRFSLNQIDISNLGSIEKFKTIKSLDQKGDMVAQAIITSNNKILYSISEDLNFNKIKDPTKPRFTYKIFIMNPDGTENKMLVSLSDSRGITLQGLDEDRNLLYLWNHDNNSIDAVFVTYDLTSSTFKNKWVLKEQRGTFNLTSDFQKAYYIEQDGYTVDKPRRVVEFNLVNGEKKVIHELQSGNSGSVSLYSTVVMLSPANDRLLFGFTDNEGSHVKLVDLTNFKITELVSSKKLIGGCCFSPDGKYIFIAGTGMMKLDHSGYENGTFYLVDLDTKENIDVTSQPVQTVRVVTWVTQ